MTPGTATGTRLSRRRSATPLKRLRELLEGAGLLTTERIEQLRRDAADTVDAATEAAEAAPFPDDDDVMRYVFEEEDG